MKFKPIVWEQKTSPYTNGKNAFVGGAKIGWFDWNGMAPRGADKERWRVGTFLPGMFKERTVATEADAMALVQRAYEAFQRKITEDADEVAK